MQPTPRVGLRNKRTQILRLLGVRTPARIELSLAGNSAAAHEITSGGVVAVGTGGLL